MDGGQGDRRSRPPGEERGNGEPRSERPRYESGGRPAQSAPGPDRPRQADAAGDPGAERARTDERRGRTAAPQASANAAQRPAAGANPPRRPRSLATPVPVAPTRRNAPPASAAPPPAAPGSGGADSAAGRRPRRMPTQAPHSASAAASPAAAPPAEELDRRSARTRRGALPEAAEPAPSRRAPPPRPAIPERPAPPRRSASEIRAETEREREPVPEPVPFDPPLTGPATYAEAGEYAEPAPYEAPEPLPDVRDTPRLVRRRESRVIDAPDSDAIVENGPIVAPDTIAGRGLTALVAIMTFLCALLLGAALIIDRAADAWSANVLEEVSVAVLPLDDEPMETRLEAAATILRAEAGLSDVTILPAAQSDALLEPWLGVGADLSLLPVPRLITAQRGEGLDADGLAARLGAVAGTSLDDHTGWSERLSTMAAAVAGGAIAGLSLMLAATAIAIVFATRATIATNATTVEVLHLLGAEDRFVQRAFRRRFVHIGLKGAAVGLAVALVLFGALEAWSVFSPAAASAQSQALLGAPRIGVVGFGALVVLAVLIAALVAFTTGFAVRHHLRELSR